MMFDFSANTFESEKERNCYYKFFCGYFFNDLVAGWENRLSAFCKLLADPGYPKTGDVHHRHICPCTLTSQAHVSFDNYSYMFNGCGTHRGEFADVFLHDRSTRTLVCIEAKMHDDWSYKKDVAENARRVREIAKRLGNCTAVHCLLIKDAKLRSVRELESHPNSNWKIFQNDTLCATRIITWEQLMDISENRMVAAHLESQIRRLAIRQGEPTIPRYEFRDGWFVQA